MNNDLGIIIVAGGTSSRYGKNKLLDEISGIPVFVHSLKNFKDACPDNQIALVCSSNNIEIFKNAASKAIPENNFLFIIGGNERFNSVINGLNSLPLNVKYVAVHDAARPLTKKNILEQCIESCIKHGSGITAKKVTDTIKVADKNLKVNKTIDRTNLWSMETPQVFKLIELINAYKKITDENLSVTDDAEAMELSGHSVYLVNNPEPNIKITFPNDISYVESLI